MSSGWATMVPPEPATSMAAKAGRPLTARRGPAARVPAVVYASFLLRCAQASVTVMLGLYLAQLQSHGAPVSASLGGVLLSSTFAVEFALAPVLGTLSDRFGRKPIILVGPIIGMLAAQVYALSGEYPALFLGRALEGLSAAALTPATLGLLADYTSHEKTGYRGRTMAYFEIALLVGIGAGSALGGVIWQALDVNSFRVAGALYLASALVIWLWVSQANQVRRPSPITPSQYLKIVRRPAVLTLAPAWLCITAANGLWANNLVLQLAGPPRPGQLLAGLSGSQVSLGLSLVSLSIFAGTLTWGSLFARIPSKPSIMLISLVGWLAAELGIVALNHWGAVNRAGTLALGLVVMLALAVLSGLTPAALAHMADITEALPADRGAVMAIYSVLLGVGQVAGGALGGPIAYVWGLDGMALLSLPLIGVAFVSASVLKSRELGR